MHCYAMGLILHLRIRYIFMVFDFCFTDYKGDSMKCFLKICAMCFEQGGSSAQLSKAMPDKVGRLVDQALTKAWKVENIETMEIVKNMVILGNFLSVWKFYGMWWLVIHTLTGIAFNCTLDSQ